MRRFCAYIEKIFGFSGLLGRLTDSRQLPRISTRAVWLSGFFMSAMRCRSLNAVESELRVPRRFEPLIGPKKPSADTIGRVFAAMPSTALREILSTINHRLKRNKLLPLKWPWRFVALDGHEFFSLQSALLLGLPTSSYQSRRR